MLAKHLRRSILARLVRPSRSACWPWTGAVNGEGYGVVRVYGQVMYVHRFMLETFLGRRIKAKHDAHHDPEKGCSEDKTCANPTHLTEVPAPKHRQWNFKGRRFESREQFRARNYGL